MNKDREVREQIMINQDQMMEVYSQQKEIAEMNDQLTEQSVFCLSSIRLCICRQ